MMYHLSHASQHASPTDDAKLSKVYETKAVADALRTEEETIITDMKATHHGPLSAACASCGKVMLKRNIARHQHTVHQKNITSPMLPAMLVSPKNGIYMVCKSLLGNQHPLHVQICTSLSAQTIACESQPCTESGKAYSRGQFASFCCDHVIAAQQCPISCLGQKAITVCDLDSVINAKYIQNSSRHELSVVLNICDTQGVPPVVSWQPCVNSSLYVYFSMQAKSDKHYAKFGRVIVRYNSSSGQMDCPCVNSVQQCLHKKLAKVHLYVHHQDMVIQSNCDENIALPVDDKCSEPGVNTISHEYLDYLRPK